MVEIQNLITYLTSSYCFYCSFTSTASYKLRKKATLSETISNLDKLELPKGECPADSSVTRYNVIDMVSTIQHYLLRTHTYMHLFIFLCTPVSELKYADEELLESWENALCRDFWSLNLLWLIYFSVFAYCKNISEHYFFRGRSEKHT